MYLGDFTFGTTVNRKFTTVGSSGAPAALSSAAVVVYRSGSTVETSSGVVLTVSYDTRTGLNDLTISMATNGIFSSAGSFSAVISSGGVASADLAGYVVAEWSLGRIPFFSTIGLETLSTAGLETLSTAGLETLSSAGLETVSSTIIAASVWHATRANFTGSGSFGQIVSTSTAAPLLFTSALATGTTLVNVVEWGGSTVAGMPHDSSVVTSQFSTAGLETLSTAGLETLSTAGLETLSTAGLETLSTQGIETVSSTLIAAAVWRSTRASHTAAGTFGQILSTSTSNPFQSVRVSTGAYNSSLVTSQFSTAGLETLSTAGLETGSSLVTATNFSTLVTATNFSTAGLETASSLVTVAGNVVLAATGLNLITLAQPGAGTPTSLPTFPDAMGRVYHTLRNQVTISSSAKVFYGQAGNILWGKVLSQDSTSSTGVYTESGASTST